MTSPRIVFMGTPEFAVSTLKALVENNYKVVGVITVPDKPAGRGRKINESAVKKYAESVGLNILQPVKLKDEGFLTELKALKADLQIVVAFRMLPQVVWDMPKMGTFNLHASLLPQYRGAAPINWAVINGERKTGITTFLLNENIDEGNILLQEEIEIGNDDDAGIVHDKLMNNGSSLVLKTVDALIKSEISPKAQDMNIESKPAPKIFKEDCKINWSNNTGQIHNHIRGLSPFPGAWTKINNSDKVLEVKILKSKVLNEEHNFTTGKIVFDKKSLKVAVNSGFLEILELQLPGKKRMKSSDLLNGYKFSENAQID